MGNWMLVVIDKEYLGEPWSNTHAFTNLPEVAEVREEDLLTLITTPLLDGVTDAETDPTDEAYKGASSALAAVIGFERLMHHTSVKFTRAYISDGKNPGDPTPVFATFSLNFFGLVPTLIGDVVAPLSNVLQIDRTPYSLSNRQGRLQLRGAMLRTQTMAGPVDGIDLAPEAVAPLTARLADAMADSFMNTWLFPGDEPDSGIKYIIPKYGAKGTPNYGKIVSRAMVGGLQLDGAKARQVHRGKKRST